MASPVEAAVAVLAGSGFYAQRLWLDSCLQQLPTHRLNASGIAQALFLAIINTDLRRCAEGCLPSDLNEMDRQVLEGPLFLQIDELVNVGATADQRNTDVGGPNGRLLKMCVTDGKHLAVALEQSYMRELSALTTAGCKLIVKNVEVRRGMLLFQPDSVHVIGGAVQNLAALQQAVYGNPAIPSSAGPGLARPSGSIGAGGVQAGAGAGAGAGTGEGAGAGQPELHQPIAMLGTEQQANSGSSAMYEHALPSSQSRFIAAFSSPPASARLAVMSPDGGAGMTGGGGIGREAGAGAGPGALASPLSSGTHSAPPLPSPTLTADVRIPAEAEDDGVIEVDDGDDEGEAEAEAGAGSGSSSTAAQRGARVALSYESSAPASAAGAGAGTGADPGPTLPVQDNHAMDMDTAYREPDYGYEYEYGQGAGQEQGQGYEEDEEGARVAAEFTPPEDDDNRQDRRNSIPTWPSSLAEASQAQSVLSTATGLSRNAARGGSSSSSTACLDDVKRALGLAGAGAGAGASGAKVMVIEDGCIALLEGFQFKPEPGQEHVYSVHCFLAEPEYALQVEGLRDEMEEQGAKVSGSAMDGSRGVWARVAHSVIQRALGGLPPPEFTRRLDRATASKETRAATKERVADMEDALYVYRGRMRLQVWPATGAPGSGSAPAQESIRVTITDMPDLQVEVVP